MDEILRREFAWRARQGMGLSGELTFLQPLGHPALIRLHDCRNPAETQASAQGRRKFQIKSKTLHSICVYSICSKVRGSQNIHLLLSDIRAAEITHPVKLTLQQSSTASLSKSSQFSHPSLHNAGTHEHEISPLFKGIPIQE